jgi:hypothetical protein
VFNVSGETIVAAATNPAGCPLRVYAAQKQCLIGVNVAHANDNAIVHDETFDRSMTVSACLKQVISIK